MRWSSVAFLGGVCAVLVLLAPALRGPAGTEALVSALPSLGFFASGAVAGLLRPRHPVGQRLLAVGASHLGAVVVAALVAPSLSPGWGALVADGLALLLFLLGFVALLDLLVRYPDGRYAWVGSGWLVRLAAAAAVASVVLTLLGSRRIPSVTEDETGANPAHVSAFEPLAGAPAVLFLAPLAGLVLLLVRYRQAPAVDRAQMHWPLLTGAALAVALVTSGPLEDALGAPVQTAVFVATVAVLPASFLVGLLRHSDEVDRLAAVEASRARLAAVADAERRRLERDLHDGAQQQLLALLARVELARARLVDAAPAVDGELVGIAEGVRRAHHDLRELAHGVRPAVLADEGLVEALRSAVARVPLTVELDIAPEVEGVRYNHEIEAAAYYLVLEGLANVLKHSGAPEVRVRLTACADALEVSVCDDGARGAADDDHDDSAVRRTAAAGWSTGLLGLQDRVAAVGGRLELLTGAGTTLRGVLPGARRVGA
jgi:signal transduction histidine kinase